MIWRKQNEFAARRYWVKGITNYTLPYEHLVNQPAAAEAGIAAELVIGVE